MSFSVLGFYLLIVGSNFCVLFEERGGLISLLIAGLKGRKQKENKKMGTVLVDATKFFPIFGFQGNFHPLRNGQKPESNPTHGSHSKKGFLLHETRLGLQVVLITRCV